MLSLSKRIKLKTRRLALNVFIAASLIGASASASAGFFEPEHSLSNVIGPEAVGIYQPSFEDVTVPLVAAAGDSISTHIAISSGYGQEANGLVNTSSGGLIGLFVLKSAIVYVADKHLTGNDRKVALKTTSALWGGATANNIAIATGATNPVALAVGIAAGVGFWYYEDRILDKEAAVRRERERVYNFYAL